MLVVGDPGRSYVSTAPIVARKSGGRVPSHGQVTARSKACLAPALSACQRDAMKDILNLAGRCLIAVLFLGGAAQKVTNPAPVVQMIGSIGLPAFLVWPIALFDLVAGLALIFGPGIEVWALLLAAYCVFTSWFHWQLRADPWQVTIMVKNWSIAGGLLILAAHGPGRLALRWPFSRKS